MTFKANPLWRIAFLFLVAGPRAFAGGATAQAISPYALPTIYPNYPADSTFRSLLPERKAPTPVPIQVPASEVGSPQPSSPQGNPVSTGGIYSGGQPGNPAPASGAGNSGFYSDQPPIVDPNSVPKEITFGAHPEGTPSSQPLSP